MKQLFWILSLVLLIACDSDDYSIAGIPSIVLNEFRLSFPDAKDVEWVSRDSLYEVNFEVDNVEHAALFNGKGNVIRRKQEISISEIPPEVLTGLSRNFRKDEIEDPEIIEDAGSVHYQMELKKILFDDKIVLDKNGKTNPNLPFWN